MFNFFKRKSKKEETTKLDLDPTQKLLKEYILYQNISLDKLNDRYNLIMSNNELNNLLYRDKIIKTLYHEILADANKLIIYNSEDNHDYKFSRFNVQSNIFLSSEDFDLLTLMFYNDNLIKDLDVHIINYENGQEDYMGMNGYIIKKDKNISLPEDENNYLIDKYNNSCYNYIIESYIDTNINANPYIDYIFNYICNMIKNENTSNFLIGSLQEFPGCKLTEKHLCIINNTFRDILKLDKDIAIRGYNPKEKSYFLFFNNRYLENNVNKIISNIKTKLEDDE